MIRLDIHQGGVRVRGAGSEISSNSSLCWDYLKKDELFKLDGKLAIFLGRDETKEGRPGTWRLIGLKEQAETKLGQGLAVASVGVMKVAGWKKKLFGG